MLKKNYFDIHLYDYNFRNTISEKFYYVLLCTF
jgi:hypothetical protein